MSNKQYLFAVAFALLGFVNAQGEAIKPTAGYWRKDPTTSIFDGVLTDTAHWNTERVPGTKEMMIFQSKASYTVDFPAGSYTNAAEFQAWGCDGFLVTFDGTGRTWFMNGSDSEDVHGDSPFDLRSATETASDSQYLLGLKVSPSDDYRHPILEFSDFKINMSGSHASPRLEFDGGAYDFRDPGGVDWTTSSKPLLLFAQGKVTASQDIVFKNGASLRAWNVGLQASAPVNAVTFDGGTHYFEELKMPDGSVDYYNALANQSDLVLTNGAQMSVAKFDFGHRANKVVRTFLAGEDTELTVRGAAVVSSAGISHLDIRDGATLTLKGDASFTGVKGGTNYTTMVGGNLVHLQSGGTLKFAAHLDGKGEASLVDFSAKGGSVSAAGTIQIDGAHTSMRTADTTWSAAAVTVGTTANGGNPYLFVSNGTFTVTENLSAGQESPSRLEFSMSDLSVGGQLFVDRDSTLSLVGVEAQFGVMNVAGNVASGKPTVALTNGAVSVAGAVTFGMKAPVDLSVNGGSLASAGNLNLARTTVRVDGEASLAAPNVYLSGNTDMTFDGTSFDASVLQVGTTTAGRLVVAGGSVTLTNESCIGNSTVGELVITGGTVTAYHYFDIGINASGDGTLTVAGGEFINNFTRAASPSPSPVSTVTYLGKDTSSAKGVLNVTGGRAEFLSLYAGWAGSGEINVSGGTLYCKSDLRLGNAALSDNAEHVLTQTGGLIDLAFNSKNIGMNAAARARVKLNGGVFACKSLQAGGASAAQGGTGHVALEADGGTLAASVDSTTYLCNFDEVTVNAGGLTIDTQGHAITLNQDISGTGTLTLTGGGTVTFTAGNTIAVSVKVVGDTKVVFNGVVPKGLTLGDAEGAAVLELAAGTAVAVDGDLVIAGKGVDLTVSGLVLGNAYDVLTATGVVDADTAAKWAAIDVKGVPATAAYDARIAENGGTTALRLVIRDPQEIPLNVSAGSHETRTDDISWSVNDRLVTTVGEGGELRLEGELRKGFLIKDGFGTLTLSNPDSYLFNGVLFRLGTLNFDYPEDGALADWSITLDANSAFDVLRLTSGKSVTIRDLGVAGTGALEISTADEIALGVPNTTQRRQEGYVRVGEGTLAIRGTGVGRANVSVSLPNGVRQGSPVIIGHGGAGGEKAGYAKLVLDNVSFSGGIALASNINDSAALVNEAYLVITNNGKQAGSVTIFEDSLQNLDAKVGILVDGGTLNGTCEVKYNHLKTPPQVTVRNGGYLLGGWYFRGDADILLDASTMAGDDKGTPIVCAYYSNWDFTNNFTFVNGSVLNAKNFECGTNYKYAYPAHFHLHFDDSEWKGMPDGFFGAIDPKVKAKNPDDVRVNPYVEVRVKNTGLKLNVPADATYSWAFPLMDESADVAGGFVKQGEGTLKVLKKTNPDGTFTDDFSFAHTGPTVVEAGVLDLDGNTWTRGTIGGGAGVFANGTLKGAKIALEIESGEAKATPNFAPTCAFAGRTKVDLGGANLPVGATLTVANYTGADPNVSNWKLIGNGETSGKFMAAGGVITAEVTPKNGMLLIVR